jgi:hypothetical protein
MELGEERDELATLNTPTNVRTMTTAKVMALTCRSARRFGKLSFMGCA